MKARLLSVLAIALLLGACTDDDKEPLLTKADVEQRIEQSGKDQTEVWLRDRIEKLRFSSAWHYHPNFKELMARTKRLHELYFEFFADAPGATRVRVNYGHQLFAKQGWAEAAEQYEAAVHQLGEKKDPASVKMNIDAGYHAVVSRAHLAELAARPLELPDQTALQQRLRARAGLNKGPKPGPPRKSKPLDTLMAKITELEARVPELKQMEYVLQLAGRAHHLRGETEPAEARLQQLLNRKPGALDTWLVTPLLLDCLVRNGKLDQARELARQLLDQPPRQWNSVALVKWDRELGGKLQATWKPVFEALARSAAE